MSKTYLVPLRSQCTDGGIAGLIDVRRCAQLTSRVGGEQDSLFEWKHLLHSPAGRFLIYSFVQKPEPPYEEAKKYAVFITEQEAVVWFADHPEFAPECIRPLFEKFDLTEAPTASLSENGRAPSGNGIAATRGISPSPSRESTPEADGDVWISFAKAHEVTGLEFPHLTKLCNSGKVRSKGGRKGRQIHALDLMRFMHDRRGN